MKGDWPSITHSFFIYFYLNCQIMAKKMHSCVALALILKPTYVLVGIREREEVEGLGVYSLFHKI